MPSEKTSSTWLYGLRVHHRIRRLQTPCQPAVLAVQDVAAPTEVGAIARQLGYEGELTIGALEDGIRFYQRRTVEACLELGKRLLLLKELTPHGEFEPRVELLGFAPQSARRFIGAAAKTAKSLKMSDLSTRAKNVSAFLELVTHADDEDALEALSQSDGLACMTKKDLRAYFEKREANLQKEITRQEEKLATYAPIPKTTASFDPKTEFVRRECVELEHTAGLVCEALLKLFDDELCNSALHSGVSAGEKQTRLEQVWVASHVVAARVFDFLATLKTRVPEGDMPTRITGNHVLTAEEAHSWLLDAPLITNRFVAAQGHRFALAKQQQADSKDPVKVRKARAAAVGKK